MKQITTALAVFVACIVVGIAAPPVLKAQSEGETIEFIVPRGTQVTAGAGNDLLLFTGRSQGTTTTLGDCGSQGEGHVYDTTIVSPNSGTAARRVEVIVVDIVADGDAIRPGTRLGELEILGVCTAGTTEYDKYRGRVQ